MRDAIILAGGYRLPDGNASAIRALGIAALFRSLGYQVLVLGKLERETLQDFAEPEVLVDGIPCLDIRQPVSGQRFRSYVTSADPVIAAIDRLGAGRVRAVLAYNYPARGAFALIRACRARGIAPVLDCTEWYGWQGGKILRNIWRLTGVAVRMHLLTRLAGNVVCASSWFQVKLPSQHTLLLPFVLDTANPRWARTEPDSSAPGKPVRFVYAGSPGVGLHKDLLPLMIQAFATLVREGRAFDCAIAGLTEAQYLAQDPAAREMLAEIGGKLRFLGRISHVESLEQLRRADFAVFFRQSNRVSNTGFSTKFVEAATLGVPVISNATSDMPRYLRHGDNGIMASGISVECVTEALRRALTLSPQMRAQMRAACLGENPFAIDCWAKSTADFLQNLRGLE